MKLNILIWKNINIMVKKCIYWQDNNLVLNDIKFNIINEILIQLKKFHGVIPYINKISTIKNNIKQIVTNELSV